MNYRLYVIGVLGCLLTGTPSVGQLASRPADSLLVLPPVVQVSGFVDVYFGYDFNRPTTGQRLPFVYNHNRHRQIALNLGYIRLAARGEGYRAHLALQSGTYAHDNYAAEPVLFRSLFEANAGLALNPARTVWLDAGILPSHIGFESAVSSDNWTLTRGLAAENSPYFLTGAQLTLTPNDRWKMAALVCNGWQRIRPVPGSTRLSFGTQLQYSPTPGLLLNWSTFLGTDDPDSLRRNRYFSNVYGQVALTGHLGLQAGFDVGWQQRVPGSSRYAHWLTPVLIARYRFSERWALALRAEHYRDATGVMIPAPGPGGFAVTGTSLTASYSPYPAVALRLEGRWFRSPSAIFERAGQPVRDNAYLMASLAVKFGEE
jgi:hypothetical protein